MMFESLSNHNINYYLKSYNKYKTSHRWTYEIQISYSYIVKMSNKIAKDHHGGGAENNNQDTLWSQVSEQFYKTFPSQKCYLHRKS